MRYFILGFVMGSVSTYITLRIFKPCIHNYINMTHIDLDEHKNYIICVKRFCNKCMKERWKRRLTKKETQLWKKGVLKDVDFKKKAKNYEK